MITAERVRTLFLFRHGETAWNRGGRIQGHLDVPLAASGRAQALILKPHLGRLAIQAILSSDLCRAWETAELAQPHAGIRIFKDTRLRETFLGPIQGMTKDEIVRDFPESKRLMNHGVAFPYLTDEAVQEMGGETAAHVIARARAAVEEFLLNSPFLTIGVSSHGGVIRRLLELTENAPGSHTPVPNACIYPLEIDLETRRWRIMPSLPLPSSPRSQKSF